MAALRRLQAEIGFALEELDISADDALHRAYFERIPVVALDGEELCEYFVEEALVRERLKSGDELRRTDEPLRRWRRDGAGATERATFAGRRRTPVALPAGAHAGQEDGQGDDLLAGALRLHARQLDADPARPLGLRQVRQARGGLQRRGARLADPQDPAHRRTAQHRADRRRPPRQGDRLLGHLRRPRLSRGRDLRQRRRQGRQRARQPA